MAKNYHKFPFAKVEKNSIGYEKMFAISTQTQHFYILDLVGISFSHMQMPFVVVSTFARVEKVASASFE